MKNEKKMQTGNITCNKNILLSIISLATKEINGVAGISKVGLPVLKTKDYSGIKVKFDSNGNIVVDVYIDVYYNHSAPDISFRVQENVRNNIRSMVDMKTAKVNVHIVNVIIEKENDDENASKNSDL